MRAIDLDAGALAVAATMDALAEVATVIARVGLADIRDRPTIKLVTNTFINTVYASTVYAFSGKTPKTPVMMGSVTQKATQKPLFSFIFQILTAI